MKLPFYIPLKHIGIPGFLKNLILGFIDQEGIALQWFLEIVIS